MKLGPVDVSLDELRRVGLDTLGVIGFCSGMWCLLRYSDLMGAGVSLAGGAALVRILVRV